MNKNSLNKNQKFILKEKGTETAFSGDLLYNKEKGFYSCVGCGNKLFSSEKKYDSGSGWPSFYDIYNSKSIKTEIDYSDGMERTEVISKQYFISLFKISLFQNNILLFWFQFCPR